MLGLTAAIRSVARVFLIVALAGSSAFAGASEDFVQLRDEVWDATLSANPTLATRVGNSSGDGKLADLSLAEFDRQTAEAKTFLTRLEAIDPSALSDADQIDYALMKRSFEDQLAAAAFDQTRYSIFTHLSGWFADFATLAYTSPFFTLSDYDSYIARLNAFGDVNAQGIARSRVAVDLGLTQSCAVLGGLEARIRAYVFEEPSGSLFWAPFRQRPDTIAPDEWERLQAEASTALMSVVLPAYQDFLTFYTEEYFPACRAGVPGISATPEGGAYYAHLAQTYTTTDMTPDAIHQLGLSEVQRIRAEMEALASEAGFESREAFIEHLRTDPQYFATDEDAYVAHVAALAKEIDGWMPKLFGQLPRLPYTVKPIPAASAPGNTTAYYEPGSLDIGQAGVYRINTTALSERPLWELPALGVHEAVPGHHHQFSIQQELDMHPLRANGTFFIAFLEGWGLYSERLGIEMGLYDTPAKTMGRLSYEMWRATRLVVDTGIHSKGWSKQQAVTFMLDNTALTPTNIDAEVNRYIAWPGQALAYKIGELKIRELRARSEQALGAAFDLRAFHDTVLENGSIPLDVLEAHVNAWLAAERGT